MNTTPSFKVENYLPLLEQYNSLLEVATAVIFKFLQSDSLDTDLYQILENELVKHGCLRHLPESEVQSFHDFLSRLNEMTEELIRYGLITSDAFAQVKIIIDTINALQQINFTFATIKDSIKEPSDTDIYSSPELYKIKFLFLWQLITLFLNSQREMTRTNSLISKSGTVRELIERAFERILIMLFEKDRSVRELFDIHLVSKDLKYDEWKALFAGLLKDKYVDLINSLLDYNHDDAIVPQPLEVNDLIALFEFLASMLRLRIFQPSSLLRVKFVQLVEDQHKRLLDLLERINKILLALECPYDENKQLDLKTIVLDLLSLLYRSGLITGNEYDEIIVFPYLLMPPGVTNKTYKSKLVETLHGIVEKNIKPRLQVLMDLKEKIPLLLPRSGFRNLEELRASLKKRLKEKLALLSQYLKEKEESDIEVLLGEIEEAILRLSTLYIDEMGPIMRYIKDLYYIKRVFIREKSKHVGAIEKLIDIMIKRFPIQYNIES